MFFPKFFFSKTCSLMGFFLAQINVFFSFVDFFGGRCFLDPIELIGPWNFMTLASYDCNRSYSSASTTTVAFVSFYE